MTPVCDWCGLYIEQRNRLWPGFCCPLHRDYDRANRHERQQSRAERRRRLADR